MLPTVGETSGFVVRNINADFLATSTLGDMLHVTTELLTLKSSSLILLQEVWKDEVKLFSMKIVLVYISEGKPSRIPTVFKEIFNSFCLL
jgi:acyl-CoA thioester hydrolase